jgi:hypothetical protein
MVVSVLVVVFIATGVIDIIGAAVVRKEAQRQAALLYRQPVTRTGSPPDYEKYPELLRAYFRAGRFDTQPCYGNVLRMRQKGAVRFREGQGWKPFEAKCFIALQSDPALVWYADVTVGLLRSRSLLHILSGEKARWVEKMWGFNIRPYFTDCSNLRAYLLIEYYATAVWHPALWLTPSLDWEVAGKSTLVARTIDPAFPLAFTLQFGQDALLESMIAKLGNSTWTTTYSGYQEVHGVMVPLVWRVEIFTRDHKWVYLEGKVTDMVSDGVFSWW